MLNGLKRACVVPVNGPATLAMFDGTMKLFDAEIGGDYFDCTRLDDHVQAWVGDTSVVDGEPVNWRVTQERNRLLEENGQEPHPTPLCGNVVLLGLDPISGEAIDLPEEWQSALAPTGRLGWI